MTTNTPAPPQKPRSHLPWFLAWVGVGVGFALGVSALGVFAVPLALVVTVLLVAFHHADRTALGILVGIGLLSLYVAYVQREGPGTLTWHTGTASGSEQYLDPRPWLIVGIVLVIAGVATFVWRERRRS
jgi:hypothetical protein